MIKNMLALLTAAICLMPAAAAAQQAENARMIQIFSQTLRGDTGNLQVVVLNDKTVDALFGNSPAKAAFRTKARMTTVFFVQGTASRDFEFTPEVTVDQKGETIEGKVTSMKNFTAGKVARGDQIQGLVELPVKLDLYEAFKVTVGGRSFDFRLNQDDVRDHGNR